MNIFKMNVLKRELKSNLKSLIIWNIGMVVLIYTGMMKYKGYANTGREINELFDSFPSVFKSIFNLEGISMSSITGFYSLFFIYFTLLTGAHAVMIGAILISKEERDKTADFLFAKPVSRFKIITAKLIAGFVNILVLNLTTLATSLIVLGENNSKNEPYAMFIVRLMLAMIIFQLLYYSAGLLISSLAKTSRQATSISTFILLITFILSIAIDLNENIDWLKYLTPFKYFQANKILATGSIKPGFILLSVVITIIFILLTYKKVQKRDLKF